MIISNPKQSSCKMCATLEKAMVEKKLKSKGHGGQEMTVMVGYWQKF